MKKKLIALFAACSMIVTAAAGLVQTAYAAEPGLKIEVADGATDTQKVLTFYYEGINGFSYFDGVLSFDNNDVVIDSAEVTLSFATGMGDTASEISADKKTVQLGFSYYDDGGVSSEDGSFATVTITVPEGEDVTANYACDGYADEAWNMFDATTVSVTIPKKAAPIPQKVPAAVTAVELQNADPISGTGEYETQTADIYGVEITPNDESVSGATVSVGEKTKDISFKTVYSGKGTVVFAVILASESGDPLPALSADNVTPIVATIE